MIDLLSLYKLVLYNADDKPLLYSNNYGYMDKNQVKPLKIHSSDIIRSTWLKSTPDFIHTLHLKSIIIYIIYVLVRDI